MHSTSSRLTRNLGAAILAVVWLTIAGTRAFAADVTISVPTTFAAADASDGTIDQVFNVLGDLKITSTGSIACNDVGDSGNSACPIKIVVTGNMLMEAGSSIRAENTNNGGDGGNITIIVGTVTIPSKMTMCGQTGTQPGCLPQQANPGALISSRKTSGAGDTGVGGDISITVGSAQNVTGTFYMEGGTKAYGTETGARITTTGRGESGDITINPGLSYFSEPGSVVEAGDDNGTAIAQGGKIFVVSGCGLTTQGRITSKGTDPGADLIHLEACDVLIQGLVESTGKGHTNNIPNSCDNINDGLVGEVFRAGKPSNATGCIEVWGKQITIDSTTDPTKVRPDWAGELNADIGNGGSSGTSWIDIFAYSKLTVTDGTGNDRISNNLGGDTYFSTYAVHANSIAGSSDVTPGEVTALVKNGPMTASGNAFEASATMNNLTGHGNVDTFVGNGSTGGTINLEASGKVTLDDARLNASGDFFGGSPCPIGSGACGDGGHIVVKAWGSGSDISWKNGDGDVRPNDSGGFTVGGDITLTACNAIDVSGTEFHLEMPSTSTGGANCDATKPAIPVYNTKQDGTGTVVVIFNQATWAVCGASTISGIKFNDLNGDHIRNGTPVEPTLSGWVMTLWNANQTVAVATTATGANGSYNFPNVTPGSSYVVCETQQTGWTQTAPVAGTGVVACNTGGLGYVVDLTESDCCSGQNITGKDFGNVKKEEISCPEDPNRAALLTRTVNLSKGNLSGTGVAGDPKNYWTVQAAYNAAKSSAQSEVIGIFANTSENLLLDGTKSLTITQCTCARVTAASSATPVWDITSTGKLTIIGPDSVGGTIGWRVGGNGGHNLKSVRASGASQWGVQILSSNNAVSWNSINNNTGGGLQAVGNTNDLRGSTIASNGGDGVHLFGNGNILSGASNIVTNVGNGVWVQGSTNTVKDNGRINQNLKNGILVTGVGNTLSGNKSESGKGNTWNGIQVTSGSGNQLTGNQMNSSVLRGFDIAAGIGTKLKGNTTSNNTGTEYQIGAGNVDQGSNKKNGSSFTFTNAGGTFN